MRPPEYIKLGDEMLVLVASRRREGCPPDRGMVWIYCHVNDRWSGLLAGRMPFTRMG